MGYFKRRIDRDRSRRQIRALNDEGAVRRPWEAIPDRPPTSRCFVRFSTHERHPLSARRVGIFSAAYEVQRSDDLEPHVASRLLSILEWFGENLYAPSLKDDRAIFLFKSDAGECMRRIWELAASLREVDVRVEMQTFENPGRVVFEDEHQIAVIPWADAAEI